MRNQFDQERATIDTKLDALRGEMKQCHVAFVKASATYLSDWYQQQVRRILAANPGRFAELPQETRSQLKQDVFDLIGNANGTVNRFFAQADIWWDEKDPSAARGHYSYEIEAGRPPQAIDEPLRFAMGALLPIMERHGFCATGFALRRLGDSFDDKAARFPYFRQRYQSSGEMVSLLNSYSLMHGAASDAERQLVEVDRDEQRAQDQLLWDQA